MYDPEKITFFAKTDARGQHVPFGIKAKDRTKHVYVVGKTGMGKSTLLENMAIQDIQNGEGIAFIDPHGATAEKLLEYVPEERIDDVLYFAPFDMEYPVSFNVMEDVGPDKRHLVVSGLMSTFKKIWVDAWSARMEYILSNTLLALLEYPDSTLLGVNRMLSDKAYREAVVENISDPSVKSFWVDEFAKYNERYMQEAGDAIKNKIGQFTANPLIRNIIGQPKSSFDVRKIMDERKILIMNLSKGLVGETNANLLGSMLITRVYLSAMSRADLSAAQIAQVPNFYFYVDEFQSFANETFASILSEARKYKLNLTIAHQYIEQMEEEVRNAVFGNVGTTITFRVGPLDAEFLEAVFTPTFMATDLVNLGFAQIYLTLMIDGIGSRPFSATTLPPIEPAHVSHRDQIVAASRRAFAHPRGEVEEMIKKWHEPIAGTRSAAQAKPPARAPRQGEGPRKGGGAERSVSKADTQMNPPRSSSTQKTTQKSGVPTERRSDARREEGGTRSETRSETRTERPTPEKRDLGELRSVLRSLSGQEQKDQKTKEGTQSSGGAQSKTQTKRGGEQRGGDLKSALADVLAQHKPDDAQPTSGARQQKGEGHAPEAPRHKRKSAKIGTQTGTQTRAQARAGDAPRDGGTDMPRAESVTTRELERMLRITGKDAPPSGR